MQEIKGLSYEERLKDTQLVTAEGRRKRGDRTITLYKLMNNPEEVDTKNAHY